MKLKIMAATVAAAFSMLTLCSCDGVHYSSDFKVHKANEYIKSAEIYFSENISDATDITYRLYALSYVSDIVAGTFTLNTNVYNYAWSANDNKLYANSSSSGVTHEDIDNSIIEHVNDIFGESDVKFSVKSSWSIPCTYYSCTDTGSELDENGNPVTSVAFNAESFTDDAPYDYIDWNMTEDDVSTFSEQLLKGHGSNIYAPTVIIEGVYDDYADIHSELVSHANMLLYPGIKSITFRPSTDNMSEYYTIFRSDKSSDSEILTEHHIKTQNDNGVDEWIVENIDEETIS